MFLQNIFSGCINHSIGHQVSFKRVWASFSVGHVESEYFRVHITVGWIWGLAWFSAGFWLVVVLGFFSFVGDMTQNLKQNWWEACKPTGLSIETRKKNAFSDPCEAILLN